MNDDLLARADRRLRPESKISVLHMEGDFKLIADLEAALRARDADLATAHMAGPLFVGVPTEVVRWVHDQYGYENTNTPLAVYRWLASVSPPASEEPCEICGNKGYILSNGPIAKRHRCPNPECPYIVSEEP